MQRIKAEAKTASGLFLTESSVKELNEAKVLAVGPGAFDKEGKRIAMGVSIGDKVLIPQVSRLRSLLDLAWVEGCDWSDELDLLKGVFEDEAGCSFIVLLARRYQLLRCMLTLML